MMRPSVKRSIRPASDRVAGERYLVATPDPENAASREALITGCKVVKGALETVPWGDGRMRAPDAVVANRRSAERHWGDEFTIRPREVRVNIVVNGHPVTPIA